MPLPIPDVERELTHTRRVRYEGYKRSDGLWDIEAHLTDIKNHDFTLQTGVRRAGQPVHGMWVRVTVDRELNVVGAVAVSDEVPYPGGCEAASAEYAKLVGLNLRQGFRRKLHELLGGVRGCTHITEMLGGLPTAAIQTLVGDSREHRREDVKPFQLDHCIALETGSETVRRWYPKWYKSREEAAKKS